MQARPWVGLHLNPILHWIRRVEVVECAVDQQLGAFGHAVDGEGDVAAGAFDFEGEVAGDGFDGGDVFGGVGQEAVGVDVWGDDE